MESTDPFIGTLHECMEMIMQRSMRHFFQYAKGIGLSMPQIGALFHLKRGGTSGISNISDDLGVTSAATSQMLDRLVQQELILRSEDPVDRRVKNIVLTDKGQRILGELLQVRQAWLEELAVALSPGEKEQIVAALKILIAKAHQLDQPAS
jgi:DNA-binding MarR family transcriptional regulator